MPGVRVGMLWFNNDPKQSFFEKVKQAVKYYERKYDRKPTVCYVHPSMLLGQPSAMYGVVLRETNMILLNHFWLGIEVEDEPDLLSD